MKSNNVTQHNDGINQMKHVAGISMALVLLVAAFVQAHEDDTAKEMATVHATKFGSLAEAQKVATTDRLVVLDFYTDW